jgi:hypothetical protein
MMLLGVGAAGVVFLWWLWSSLSRCFVISLVHCLVVWLSLCVVVVVVIVIFIVVTLLDNFRKLYSYFLWVMVWG